jgi:hypothetical protein
MVTKASSESDETSLKKKLATRQNKDGGSGDESLRMLRKRLKRAQRKRRALALRKKHAAGSGSEGKSEAAAG